MATRSAPTPKSNADKPTDATGVSEVGTPDAQTTEERFQLEGVQEAVEDSTKKLTKAQEEDLRIQNLAREVLRGDHGRGEARAKKLGKDYEKVTEEVRRIRLQGGK